jgi:hypothetical protein
MSEFFQMNKAPVQNPGLSWAARGLLAYFLSLPETWEVHLRDLFTRSMDGRRSTQAAMNELIAAGYVVKEQGKNNSNSKYHPFGTSPQTKRIKTSLFSWRNRQKMYLRAL